MQVVPERERVEARKFGKLKKKPSVETTPELPLDTPAPTTTPAKAVTTTRAPNAAMRREVSERDGDRCTYVSSEGKRCSSTAWIEHDHTDRWADTHETETERLRHLCRAHNQGRECGHDDLARSGTSD